MLINIGERQSLFVEDEVCRQAHKAERFIKVSTCKQIRVCFL